MLCLPDGGVGPARVGRPGTASGERSEAGADAGPLPGPQELRSVAVHGRLPKPHQISYGDKFAIACYNSNYSLEKRFMSSGSSNDCCVWPAFA